MNKLLVVFLLIASATATAGQPSTKDALNLGWSLGAFDNCVAMVRQLTPKTPWETTITNCRDIAAARLNELDPSLLQRSAVKDWWMEKLADITVAHYKNVK
jgi:hypothetical protein